MMPPRKIRQLPPATEASDSDVFPISQLENGIPRTRAMTRAMFVAQIVDAVAAARQGLVDEFAARDRVLEQTLVAVQDALSDNALMDAQMQATLDALQEPIQWDNIMGRPSVFAPAAHSHAWADITGKPATFAPAAHTHAWADITGKPSTFPPDAHTHAGLATLVGTATISQTATIAIAAGTRRVDVAVAGVVPGGNYLAFPTSTPPAGYGIMDVICTANGTLSVSLIAPALALLASYSIPVRIVRINT